jgi:hypothetical protein
MERLEKAAVRPELLPQKGPFKDPVQAAAEAAQKNPDRRSFKELFALGMKGADIQGLAKAAQKYEGDPARELADIEAGRHPLQRCPRAH